MKKNLIRWALVMFGTTSISLSMFLTFNPIVHAACTVTLTCNSGGTLICSGDGNTCKAGGSGGGYVRCDNGTVRTTCYCGSPCQNTTIGGGGGEISPEIPDAN